MPRTVAGPMIALAVIISALLAGGLTWWLQSSRVQAKEQERATAAAELNGLAARVQQAETIATDATQRVKQADAEVLAVKAQSLSTVQQLDVARRDGTTVRTERDEARASVITARSELDRNKIVDLDPGSLPLIDLSKVTAGTTAMRCNIDMQIVGSPVSGLDKAAVNTMLDLALASSSMSRAAQSPFKISVFVSLGKEQPRRSLGVMMLVLRIMKVPGENGQREVALWGQQRTSICSDAEVGGQLNGLIEELTRELSIAFGVRATAGIPPTTPGTPPTTPPTTPPATPPTTPPTTPPPSTPPAPPNAKP